MTTDDLRRLPEPTPPPDLAAVIMARTARLADENPALSGDSARAAVAETGRRRSTWAWTVTSLALGLGSLAYALVTTGAPLDVTSSRIGGPTDTLTTMAEMGPAALVLAAGLLLYLTGLFAPLRDTAPRPR